MIEDDFVPNPAPGDVLLEDFLEPTGLSRNALQASSRRISKIVIGKRAASGMTALHWRRPNKLERRNTRG